MFLKVMSLIALLVAIASAELAQLNCGNKSAAACKVEFVKQMDVKLKDYFIRVTKLQVADIVNTFEMALKEMPDNSPNAKLLKDAIKSLRECIAKYEANKDDYAMLRSITSDIERNMQPHLMFATPDQKSIPELEKLLEKHNYTKMMEQFDLNESMAAFGKFWQDTFAGLRPNDLKEYPAYNEINDVTKQLAKEWQNEAEFDKLAREFMMQLRKFMKIPALEILVFADREMPPAGKKNNL